MVLSLDQIRLQKGVVVYVDHSRMMHVYANCGFILRGYNLLQDKLVMPEDTYPRLDVVMVLHRNHHNA